MPFTLLLSCLDDKGRKVWTVMTSEAASRSSRRFEQPFGPMPNGGSIVLEYIGDVPLWQKMEMAEVDD